MVPVYINQDFNKQCSLLLSNHDEEYFGSFIGLRMRLYSQVRMGQRNGISIFLVDFSSLNNLFDIFYVLKPSLFIPTLYSFFFLLALQLDLHTGNEIMRILCRESTWLRLLIFEGSSKLLLGYDWKHIHNTCIWYL